MRAELVLPELHRAQSKVKDELRRFNVLNCGRRFGKDVLCMDLIIDPLLRGYPAAWYQPTYKSLAEVWRGIRYTLAPLVVRANEQEHRLELATHGVLDMWSLDNPDAGRGRKYKRAVINEAAMVKQLEYSWNNIIRPSLADYEGDAFFPSTPKGLNYFYTLWGMAENDPEHWARWRFPTSANPYIRRLEIEAMRRELPERVYRQEILAEFIKDGAYFQNVDKAATIKQPDSPAQHKSHRKVMAGDWAISQDYTVLGVACCDCNRVVDWDRFNKIDFTYQRERLYTLYDRWQPSGFLPERNSVGVPNIEIVSEYVKVMRGPDDLPGFNTTATSKPPLIQGLANAIEHHGYLVPEAAAEELRVYEVELTTGGHPKFSAPGGLHDDWVMMLAILWYAMSAAINFSDVSDLGRVEDYTNPWR